jgi:hypothetical protein
VRNPVGVRFCSDTWGSDNGGMLRRGPYGWNFPAQFIISHLCSSQFQSFQSVNRYASFQTLMKMTADEFPEISNCVNARDAFHKLHKVLRS